MSFFPFFLVSIFLSFHQNVVASTDNQARWLQTNARIINNCNESRYLWIPDWQAPTVVDGLGHYPNLSIASHTYQSTFLSPSGLNIFLVSESDLKIENPYGYTLWFVNETTTSIVSGPGAQGFLTELQEISWPLGQEPHCPHWDDQLPSGGSPFCTLETWYELRLCSALVGNTMQPNTTSPPFGNSSTSLSNNPTSQTLMTPGFEETHTITSTETITVVRTITGHNTEVTSAAPTSSSNATFQTSTEISNSLTSDEVPGSISSSGDMSSAANLDGSNMVTFSPTANSQSIPLPDKATQTPDSQTVITTALVDSDSESYSATTANVILSTIPSSINTFSAHTTQILVTGLESSSSPTASLIPRARSITKSSNALERRQRPNSPQNATTIWFYNDCPQTRYLWVELDSPSEMPTEFEPGDLAPYPVNVKNNRYMMVYQSTKSTRSLNFSASIQQGPLILNITNGITNFTAFNYAQHVNYTWTWTYGFEPWCGENHTLWNQSHVLCQGSQFYKIGLCATNFPPNGDGTNPGLGTAAPPCSSSCSGPIPFNPYGSLLVTRSVSKKHSTHTKSKARGKTTSTPRPSLVRPDAPVSMSTISTTATRGLN